MVARLGGKADRLGASRIDRVRLVAAHRSAEVRLPFRARGLSRHRLDGALIEAAARAGARIVRETIVAVAETGGGGGEIETRGKGRLRASTLFLATGKHEVRGAARPVTEPCHNIGLKQMFALSPRQRERLAGAVELYLFDGGYAGLQLVENGRANFCLVIGDSAWRARGGAWDDLVRSLTDDMPLLRERLEGAEPLLTRPLAVARIPYGFLHTPGSADGGVYRLGDQAAVIPSFSGDGMAIALHSGIAAADSFLAGSAAADYHMRLRRRLACQFAVAGGLHRLASTGRSEEHTSELQSLMRISYAVFCLKKKKTNQKEL